MSPPEEPQPEDQAEEDKEILPAIPDKYQDRLQEMSKMLQQMQAIGKDHATTARSDDDKIQTGPALSEDLTPESMRRKTPIKSAEPAEIAAQTAIAYRNASFWITRIITGVALMVLPGLLGMWLDSLFLGPEHKGKALGVAGLLLGMLAGIMYLSKPVPPLIQPKQGDDEVNQN
jgi:hypothetical protein